MKEPEKIRVMLADGEEEFCSRMAEMLRTCPQIELVGVAHDGDAVLQSVRASAPDLLVLDAMLPKPDGLLIAKRLRESKAKIGIIMLSVFISVQFGEECELLGIDELLRKPVSPEALREHIVLWSDVETRHRQKAERSDLRWRIRKILNEIGMTAGTKGCRYVTEGIVLAVTRGRQLSGMTKEVYPHIAKVYGTRAGCVERDIRNAIESAWTHGSMERQQFYMGAAYSPDKGRPTNRDFIDNIAAFLLHEEEE